MAKPSAPQLPAQESREAVATYNRMASAPGADNTQLSMVSTQLLGGYIGDAQELISGYAHVGAAHILLEFLTVEEFRHADPGTVLTPPNTHLAGWGHEKHQQVLVITMHVLQNYEMCKKTFGASMLVPAAVQEAVDTCLSNLQGRPPEGQAKVVSVKAAVAYLKRQLQGGISWDDGCRRLVSCCTVPVCCLAPLCPLLVAPRLIGSVAHRVPRLHSPRADASAARDAWRSIPPSDLGDRHARGCGSGVQGQRAARLR